MYYGVLSHLVSVISSLGTFAVFIIFMLTFVLGAWQFKRARVGEWKYKADRFVSNNKDIRDMRKELSELYDDLRAIRNDMSDYGVTGNQLNKLKKSEQRLNERIVALRKEISDAMSRGEQFRDEAMFGET